MYTDPNVIITFNFEAIDCDVSRPTLHALMKVHVFEFLYINRLLIGKKSLNFR